LRLFAVPASDRGRVTNMNEALDLYLRVREKEGRLYSDDIVRQFPEVPINHPLRAEWQARSASCRRLTMYLARLHKQIAVLDLGCGNGWLANSIAATTDSSVVGLDLNRYELQQARRVFAQRTSLSWIVTDIFSAPFRGAAFDVVVIASAIQYFADLPETVRNLIPFLKAQGEIHILDSPLYSIDALPAAQERSRQYYSRLGFPEMAAHYHHHSAAGLAEYNPAWLYVPRRPHAHGTAINDSPFPWVRLRPV